MHALPKAIRRRLPTTLAKAYDFVWDGRMQALWLARHVVWNKGEDDEQLVSELASECLAIANRLQDYLTDSPGVRAWKAAEAELIEANQSAGSPLVIRYCGATGETAHHVLYKFARKTASLVQDGLDEKWNLNHASIVERWNSLCEVVQLGSDDEDELACAATVKEVVTAAAARRRQTTSSPGHSHTPAEPVLTDPRSYVLEGPATIKWLMDRCTTLTKTEFQICEFFQDRATARLDELVNTKSPIAAWQRPYQKKSADKAVSKALSVLSTKLSDHNIEITFSMKSGHVTKCVE